MYTDTIFKSLNDLRLILLVTFLLTVFLAYQFSILIWQFIPKPNIKNTGISQTSTQQFDQSENKLTIEQKADQIANQHLFGKIPRNEVRPAVVKDAPKSSLNYKLRGIYYSEDQALASVIIQKQSKTSRFYRLGDEIDNKIYIDQIQPNHILISRLGRLEKLVLEKPTTNINASHRAGDGIRNNLPISSSSKVLQSYKRRYSKNPLDLAKRFQAVPVSENGKSIGYKLKALRGEKLLQKLNLQKDDVFVEINGIGLDKPFQALDALQSLATVDNVSLTVLRNGNRETFNFNLD